MRKYTQVKVSIPWKYNEAQGTEAQSKVIGCGSCGPVEATSHQQRWVMNGKQSDKSCEIWVGVSLGDNESEKEIF